MLWQLLCSTSIRGCTAIKKNVFTKLATEHLPTHIGWTLVTAFHVSNVACIKLDIVQMNKATFI